MPPVVMVTPMRPDVYIELDRLRRACTRKGQAGP
jgi:hypothetical protein